MLWKISTIILSRPMGIIKSAKVSESLGFDHIKLGALLQIPKNSAESDEQRMKLYTEALSQKRTVYKLRKISPIEFLQINQKLRIISYTKYCIARNYKKMTPQAQNAINNFFDVLYTVISIIFVRHREINSNHILWKHLIEGVESFNQFYYLKTNNLGNCMKFIKSAHFFKPHIQSNIFLLNFRYTLDTLNSIPLNYISQQNIYSIFVCLNRSNIRVLYFNQSLKILQHFLQPIKNTWHLQMQSRKIMLESMNRLCFYTQALLDRVEQFFKSKSYQFLEFTQLLNLMIKCKRINSNNFIDYQPVISELVKSLPTTYKKVFFNFTFSNLYMAGVWSPAYWRQFMNFISQDKQAVDFYNLYVLNQTIKILEDQIPDYIKQNLQPMKRIIESNPNFKGASMITDFTQKQREQKKLDCQNQIANSLRIMSNRNVITQQLIQFFVVDIVVENKYIIEANGATHYLSDISGNNQKFPNLKTSFRTKMLAKLGYFVIDVDLEKYSEGSFETIQTIFAIVNGNLNHDYSQLGLTVTHPSPTPTKTDKTI